MKQALEQRMSQSLVMTQQLQQSIKLLQYSAAELADFVAGEIEKNPLLSGDEADNDAANDEAPAQSADAEGDGADDYGDSLASSVRDSVDMGRDSFEATSALDAGEDAMWGESGDGADAHHEASYGESYGESYHGMSGSGGDADAGSMSDAIEQRHSESKTLRDHLLEQVMLDFADSAEQMMAAYLVDMLDENGYLRESNEALAKVFGCTEAQVEAVVSRLQQCDPVGVAARDLAECLALQLKERDRFDPAMQLLIKNLSLVAEGEVKKLLRVCKVDEEDLRDMMSELRALNPYPASSFLRPQVEAIIPDVLLRKAGDGWKVELNPDALPKVLLNKTYSNHLQQGAREKDDKKFVAEQLANAHWLLKALDQRANTLLKVSTEIVRQQEGFFRHGIHHLKPLTLLQVANAEDVSLHESSVSRVTTNKYISTPRGVFELKYFFSSSLGASRGGDDFSSRSVMQMIKDMIDREKPDDILSDDTIAEALKRRGVDVARRTVVKYRTALKIPSSVERRRLKRQAI